MSTFSLTDFFARHFRDLGPEEFIEIRAFPKNDPIAQSWHADARSAARVALAYPADCPVYFGTNARTKDGGSKEHVTKVRALHADLDCKCFADGRDGALAALNAFPLPPTVVVDSGNGFHVYWYLREAVEPALSIEALLKRLYLRLGATAIAPLDGVQDLPRVLRVPETFNNKTTPAKLVRVRHTEYEAVYTLADFETLLPAPVEPVRQVWAAPASSGVRSAYDDIPPIAEMREIMRFIPPGGDYTADWLRHLAAVHSVYPGPEGIAICEEWCPGKPGEIAKKFAGFKRDGRAADAASVGTLIYTAKQHGYEPPRRTQASAKFTMDAAPQAPAAEGQALNVLAMAEALDTARRTIAAMELQLTHCREEHARKDQHIAGLETENAALEAAIKHPDQAAGVGALDLIEAAERARKKGDILTRDGKDYARVPFKQAVNRRSQTTLARGFKSIQEAGKLDAFTRTEHIETPTYKGDVPIAYIHIPPALHGRRGAAVLAVLPEVTEKKHGGRRTIAVPAEVAAQPHPVKRERELVTRWYDALTDEKIVTDRPEALGRDYWTAQGEQRTAAEIEALRVQAGYQPAPAKPWQPTQPALRIHPDREPFQDETVSPHRGPFQDDAIDLVVKRRQDETVSPLVDDLPGRCGDADCDRRAAVGGYCAGHYPAYSRRYEPAYDYAAGGG